MKIKQMILETIAIQVPFKGSIVWEQRAAVEYSAILEIGLQEEISDCIWKQFYFS